MQEARRDPSSPSSYASGRVSGLYFESKQRLERPLRGRRQGQRMARCWRSGLLPEYQVRDEENPVSHQSIFKRLCIDVRGRKCLHDPDVFCPRCLPPFPPSFALTRKGVGSKNRQLLVVHNWTIFIWRLLLASSASVTCVFAMWILPIVGYIGVIIGVIFLTLAIGMLGLLLQVESI